MMKRSLILPAMAAGLLLPVVPALIAPARPAIIKPAADWAAHEKMLLANFLPGMMPGWSRATGVAGVNLFQKTEIFSDAYWTKANTTVGDNDTTDPVGGSTADDIRETAVTNEHSFFNTSGITITSGINYTASIYAKPNERTLCQINLAIPVHARTWFDLSGAGSVLTNNNAAAGISALGGGWFRIYVRRQSTGTTAFVGFHITTADTITSYLGVTGNGIWFWGAQLEQSNSPNNYTAVA